MGWIFPYLIRIIIWIGWILLDPDHCTMYSIQLKVPYLIRIIIQRWQGGQPKNCSDPAHDYVTELHLIFPTAGRFGNRRESRPVVQQQQAGLRKTGFTRLGQPSHILNHPSQPVGSSGTVCIEEGFILKRRQSSSLLFEGQTWFNSLPR